MIDAGDDVRYPLCQFEDFDCAGVGVKFRHVLEIPELEPATEPSSAVRRRACPATTRDGKSKPQL